MVNIESIDIKVFGVGVYGVVLYMFIDLVVMVSLMVMEL